MAAPIFNHFTYHRGPLGASLACNHCKFYIAMSGAKLPRGLVAANRKTMGDHVRNEHPEKLHQEVK